MRHFNQNQLHVTDDFRCGLPTFDPHPRDTFAMVQTVNDQAWQLYKPDSKK